MPFPESCPECGSQFRNTGTHYSGRRNEVARHVLLELGCQNTNRRYWWDFTAGQAAPDGKPAAALVGVGAATNGTHQIASTNGHATHTLDVHDDEPEPPMTALSEPPMPALSEPPRMPEPEQPSPPSVAQPPAALRDAFVRQLQLDRLTLRQMRSLLISDEARRAIEVAVGATEATYERLSLILFGVDLPQLLGKNVSVPTAQVMSAEERLELQREKARLRARLRRAAIKAARHAS
jgi:hypothetical protein